MICVVHRILSEEPAEADQFCDKRVANGVILRLPSMTEGKSFWLVPQEELPPGIKKGDTLALTFSSMSSP